MTLRPFGHHVDMRPIRLVLATLLALGLLVPLAPPGASAAPAATTRYAGEDRYDTAARIAVQRFSPSDDVVLASGTRFPDALSAASLAGLRDAPVLLTPPERLHAATREAIDAVGASRVAIVGGPVAVSDAVESDLRNRGYEVERIAGPDRFSTAEAVARIVAGSIGELAGERAAVLVNGLNFPDAIVGGAPSSAYVLPMLLTPPDQLAPQVRSVIRDLGIGRVLLLGGPAAVAPHVEEEVRSLGAEVIRIGGRDRADTAAALAYYLLAQLGFDAGEVVLARGDAFPDALAAGPLAGALAAPVLLTRSPDVLSYDMLQFAVDHAEGIDLVIGVGGRAALSDRVLARTADAADPPALEYTYEVGVMGDVEGDVGFFGEHADWTLTDQRGWSLDNDIRFTRVPSGGDFRLWLASPEVVESAAPGCSAAWSCAVGDDVYINDDNWMHATATYDHRPLDDYRHYVVLHEIGHWLGLGHEDCPGEGRRAPVMQQQSIALDGCVTNVWPLPYEREAVRNRHL